MYYICKEADSFGNYGNPQTSFFPNSLAIPDKFINQYIDARGFVNLSVADDVVNAIETNEEALASYLSEHPDTPVDNSPTDHEILMTLLGVTE